MDDNERLCALKPHLQLKSFFQASLADQRITTGLPENFFHAQLNWAWNFSRS